MRTILVGTTAAILAAAIVYFALYRGPNIRESSLEVLFPLIYMRQDATLVDPGNLNTIFEYYLVENLALGLLRDHPTGAEGYVPLIAKTWTQRNATTWDFKLRTDLTWSNGEAITGVQVAEHFQNLKTQPSRHLSSLKALKSATYSNESQTLTLTFSQTINSGLLHELTLADSALLYPGLKGRDWKITCGAYSLQSYDPETLDLTLILNPRSLLATPSSPKTVHLFWFKDGSRIAGAFKEFPVDLYYQPSHAYRQTIKTIISNAPQKYSAQANTVSFFQFDGRHPLCHNVGARREFAEIAHQTFKDVAISETIHYDRQLVPPGYAGRIKSFEGAQPVTNILRGKSIRVVLPAGFKELPSIVAKLNGVAANHGVTLVTSYSDEVLPPDQVPFVVYQIFKGNQTDPSGSWNFLFTPDVGSLAPFRQEVTPILENISKQESSAKREALLEDLHRKVLDDVYAIPFMVESNSLLASNRVDLKKINPFDLRMRFYDVIWK